MNKLQLNNKNKIRRLTHAGYDLEYTDKVGWWVDGRCGFLVAGYFSTAEEAIIKAYRKIQQAQIHSNHLTWLTDVKI